MMNMKETFLEQLVPGQAKAKQEGKCPFCQKPINPEIEFKNLLSLREFKITGLCQACQDMMFG